MREKFIEEKLKKAVKEKDGLCLKFVSPGFDGVPDRIILMPEGIIAFAELKAPGKKLRPFQERRKRQLESLGFSIFCIDNIKCIGGIIDEIYTT